jgi:hypothetical protein
LRPGSLILLGVVASASGAASLPPEVRPELVRLRLQELASASRLAPDPARLSPEQGQAALEAIRILLGEAPDPIALNAPGDRPSEDSALDRLMRRPRRERLLHLLEAFISYLAERGHALDAAGLGGGGFYTLGSLLGKPGGWNALEQGLPGAVAPALAELVPPEELLGFLASPAGAGRGGALQDAPLRIVQDPRRAASVLSLLGAHLAVAGPQEAAWVLPYVRSLARLQVEWAGQADLGRPQGAAADGLLRDLGRSLVHQLLLDPPLLIEKEELQPEVIGGVAEFMAWAAGGGAGLDRAARAALRDELLLAFNQSEVGEEFRWSEAVEAAAGVLERPALGPAGRPQAPPEGAGPFRPEPAGRILASVYSLPSHYYAAEECVAFLRELLDQLPAERLIFVLTDFRLRGRLLEALDLHGSTGRLVFLESYGRYYSPWPRDPFLFATDPAGRVALLFRPPLEKKRRDDSFLAHEIYRQLPEPLRRELGIEGLVPSPLRFHVGHLLPWRRKLYLSVHALEEETLARQQSGRLPAADRSELAGALRYLENVRVVARELGQAWGLEPVFVHPFPASESGRTAPGESSGGAPESAVALVRAGAGQDLDSYLAVVEDLRGQERAVVGSLEMGMELAAGLEAADLEALRRGLRLKEQPLEQLRARLLDHNRVPEIQGFGAYLDLVAGHLRQVHDGGEALRLPLLFFPTELLEDAARMEHRDFLLTWTNVVVEQASGPGEGTRRGVELFSQSVPAGDRLARQVFEELGYSCRIFSPLRESIVFNGGYRCASNHLSRLQD